MNGELEAFIFDDPHDPAGWLVYGDYLQSEGDPRGELVAVQARLARDPGNPALMEAQRTLFRAHGDTLLDGLHPFLTPREGPDGAEIGPLFRFSWEFGFLWTANITAKGHAIQEVLAGLRALLRHPSARFLHALTVGTPPDNDWPRVLAALVEDPAPRALRMLYLGGTGSSPNARPAFGPLGDLSELWSVFPHLEIVVLRGGVMHVGSLDLPRLRELTIETSALQRETLLALGARPRPTVERLELWFGDRRCTCTLADLAPIFAGTGLPRLTHLGLKNCAFVDRICHALVHAPLTPQLHTVNLSLGALTDEGAIALLEGAGRLAHLRVLELQGHYVRADRFDELRKLARYVDLTTWHQASDPDPDSRPGVDVDT